MPTVPRPRRPPLATVNRRHRHGAVAHGDRETDRVGGEHDVGRRRPARAAARSTTTPARRGTRRARRSVPSSAPPRASSVPRRARRPGTRRRAGARRPAGAWPARPPTSGSRSRSITWRIESRLSRPTTSARARAASAPAGSVDRARRAPVRLSITTVSEWATTSWTSRARWARSVAARRSISTIAHRPHLRGERLLATQQGAGHPRDAEPTGEVDDPRILGRALVDRQLDERGEPSDDDDDRRQQRRRRPHEVHQRQHQREHPAGVVADGRG